MDSKIYTEFTNPRSKGTVFTEPTKTQQHFKDSCDINKIMAKFKKTGLLPQVQRMPQYGDFSDVPTYEEALMRIQEIDGVFGSLPARVREKFKNNPGELLNWLNDESNRQEAIELGLIEKPEPIAQAPGAVPPPANSETATK